MCFCLFNTALEHNPFKIYAFLYPRSVFRVLVIRLLLLRIGHWPAYKRVRMNCAVIAAFFAFLRFVCFRIEIR